MYSTHHSLSYVNIALHLLITEQWRKAYYYEPVYLYSNFKIVINESFIPFSAKNEIRGEPFVNQLIIFLSF